jgi:hypothetical protein
MLIKSIITAALITVATNAYARPVSYAGGWTLIEETDRQSTSALIHYTPDASYSVGLRADWDRRDDLLFIGPQATWLAKRWLSPDTQANLYLWGAAGVVKGVGSNPAEDTAGVQLGLMSDWETRRLYLSYRASVRDYGDLDQSAMQAARFGLAPYAGDTGDLHTWLMIEVDHRPDADEPLGITPLVRFFYGPALFEAGWNVTDDQPLLNLQYRF